MPSLCPSPPAQMPTHLSRISSICAAHLLRQCKTFLTDSSWPVKAREVGEEEDWEAKSEQETRGEGRSEG